MLRRDFVPSIVNRKKYAASDVHKPNNMPNVKLQTT